MNKQKYFANIFSAHQDARWPTLNTNVQSNIFQCFKSQIDYSRMLNEIFLLSKAETSLRHYMVVANTDLLTIQHNCLL